MTGITFDDRQLSGQRLVDDAGQQGIEPHEQLFRPAEPAAAGFVAQGDDRLFGDFLRAVGLGAERRIHLVSGLRVEFGAGGAGGKVQHLDAAPLQFPSQRFAKAAQGKFAGAVDAVTGVADAAQARPHVHDDPRLAHGWQQGTGELDGRLDIEQQLALHLLEALIFQPGKLVAASVVDQDVDPVLQRRVLQQLGPLLRRAEVGEHHLMALGMGQ